MYIDPPNRYEACNRINTWFLLQKARFISQKLLYFDLYVFGDDALICKPNIYVSWTTSELRVRFVPWNGFKPSINIFLLTVPRQYFFCGSFVFLCLVVRMLLRLFIAALWSPAGKGLTSWLLLVMFIVFLLLSHVVSWVACGTWLYRFLILASFLTFKLMIW